MLKRGADAERFHAVAGTEQLAVLFPGQGSQTAGMRDQVERYRPDLLELAHAEVAPDLFERAGESTHFAQPAIFCAALAGYEALREAQPPELMAGHSLGEIAALVAAEALSAEDGLRLVAARGRLMQDAAEQGEPGSMMAVRARGDAPIEAIAGAAGVVVANYNAPDQLVLSGAIAGLDEAERKLAEVGVRAKRLPVAGAFHSPLMEPAVGPFREILDATEVREPRTLVVSCVSAQPFGNVRARLLEALTSPVRWTDVLRALDARGATRYLETGPGRVLTTLVRKTIEGAHAEAPLSMEAAGA